jgi:hypothetical protein
MNQAAASSTPIRLLQYGDALRGGGSRRSEERLRGAWWALASGVEALTDRRQGLTLVHFRRYRYRYSLIIMMIKGVFSRFRTNQLPTNGAEIRTSPTTRRTGYSTLLFVTAMSERTGCAAE